MANLHIEAKYNGFLKNFSPYLNNILCAAKPELVIPGTRKIDFWENKLPLSIQVDLQDTVKIYDDLSYTNGLLAYIQDEENANFTMLVGGLGAGKTTATFELIKQISMNDTGSISPIHLNIKEEVVEGRLPDAEGLLNEVLYILRSKLYDRILGYWLNEKNIGLAFLSSLNNQEKRTIRRLLLCNDIYNSMDFRLSEGFPYLDVDSLSLDSELFDNVSCESELRSLIKGFKKKSQRLRKKHWTLSNQKTLTIAILEHYKQIAINAKREQKLIIIDNVDQCPTEHLLDIAEIFNQFSDTIKAIPFLMPLRPSSISLRSYCQPLTRVSHYGPEPMELIGMRILTNVLGLSQEQLIKGIQANQIAKGITKSVTVEEIQSVIIISFILYSIVTYTMGSIKRLDLAPIHQDWRHVLKPFNEHISINRKHINEIYRSVTGSCCRYAIDLMRRFYEGMYRHPDILSSCSQIYKIIKRDDKRSLRTVHIKIASLMAIAFSSTGNQFLQNLFSPDASGLRSHYPSLTKLRILNELQIEKKVTLENMINHLAVYGIPQSAVLASLNAINNKDKLLVWFSKNRQISMADMDEYITISEHGMDYFNNVAGNFEYIWLCSMLNNREDNTLYDAVFNGKLIAYKNLIERLLETEKKQIAYARCSENSDQLLNANYNKTSYFSLYIILQSILTAAESAGFSATTSSTPEYRKKLNSLLTELCFLYTKIVNQADQLFPSTLIFKKYEEHVTMFEKVIKKLLYNRILTQETKTALQQIISNDVTVSAKIDKNKWDPLNNDEQHIVNINKVGIDNFLTIAIGLHSSMKRVYEKNKEDKLFSAYFMNFLRYRELLGKSLSSCFHRYPVVIDILNFADIAGSELKPMLGTAAKNSNTELLLKMIDQMHMWNNELKNNKYSSTKVSNESLIDENKAKMNKIIDLYITIFETLCPASKQPIYLFNLKWQWD